MGRKLQKSNWSLPSRERGLKSFLVANGVYFNGVAPFAGAWIEIFNVRIAAPQNIVAPFAGAWIEIAELYWSCVPMRVAPFAGAWIEM